MMPVCFAVKSGLSPHGRGNRVAGSGQGAASGSIPARAGEPTARKPPAGSVWVYPRTGGGKRPLELGSIPARAGEPALIARWGSIPARAGEPCQPQPSDGFEGVYPRTGGGTGLAPVQRRPGMGLSPHGRGNRPRCAPFPPRGGSIPARAGEPCQQEPWSARSRVYPRTGGGTLRDAWSGSTTATVYPRTGGGTMPRKV